MLISRHIPPRLKHVGSRFYAWLVGVSYWGTDPAHSTSTNRRILMCNQYVLASFMLAVPFFLLKIDEPKPRLIFVLFWGLMISSLWLNKKGHHVAGRTVFGLTITNLFFWMGIAFDARWPEYKSGFLVLQMACYSVILLIFSLQTERKLTLAFLVMAAVQMVTFNYLDHQINVFYGIISRDQLIVQHGMLLVASLLIMVLSFSIYQGSQPKGRSPNQFAARPDAKPVQRTRIAERRDHCPARPAGGPRPDEGRPDGHDRA